MREKEIIEAERVETRMFLLLAGPLNDRPAPHRRGRADVFTTEKEMNNDAQDNRTRNA